MSAGAIRFNKIDLCSKTMLEKHKQKSVFLNKTDNSVCVYVVVVVVVGGGGGWGLSGICFLISPQKTYIVGTQQKRLTEAQSAFSIYPQHKFSRTNKKTY